ncbi:DUF3817 domain-containing protein [Desertivirga brevis]|uniref:DUF3817 domain-containing protein n=1 Tax=Desertivirga brevis TaxID=2810310 RepID=UPI001F610B39|nr:DUF3817 domain-containing protein [Pedobacter sp. SYSU D00873]
MIKTATGRLRLIGYLEGCSLLILLFVGVPMKHWADNPSIVKIAGPVHGALFLWYIFNTLSVAVEHHWKFREVTWKVLVACMIPFGTFYVDRRILRNKSSDSVLETIN